MYSRRWGEKGAEEVWFMRVRTDATAVLIPRNSSRLFTLINKGKPGKRIRISGTPLSPFARCRPQKSQGRDCDWIRFVFYDYPDYVTRQDSAMRMARLCSILLLRKLEIETSTSILFRYILACNFKMYITKFLVSNLTDYSWIVIAPRMT